MHAMNMSQYLRSTFFLLVIGVMVLNACVGKFETKPALTSECQIDWQQQADIVAEILSDTLSNKSLHVLVWNIHDRLLPTSMFSSGGHTEEEIACIGDLAAKFDLVLFQEAFVRPAQIARYTNHAWADHLLFDEGGGGDWWPLRMVCEICLSPGLLMLAQDKPLFVHAEPYEAFAGWNSALNKADDFFSKGFQLVQFPSFWALNSHMDSGRGRESIEARASQFRQITVALKRLVPIEAPLFIGMDSNLRPDREVQDGEILREFLESNSLTLIQQDGPDLIATRNLSIEQSQSLPLRNLLSDHDALSAVIDLPVGANP